MLGQDFAGRAGRTAVLSVLGALLGLLMLVAGAQADGSLPDGDVARGEVLAGELCAECHRALPAEQWALGSGAVAFQDLAADRERGLAYLRAFMSREHPRMPFDQLDAQDREDILAYMFHLLPRD